MHTAKILLSALLLKIFPIKKTALYRLIKFIRWGIAGSLIVLLWHTQEKPLPQPQEAILLYTSICNDNLRHCFVQAIQSAKQSIHLVMYALTDEAIINSLNEKAKAGLAITVYHDASTSQLGFAKLQNIERTAVKRTGLMHRKILVIDEAHVWIGSANFTRESLSLHDNLVAYFHSPLLAHAILHDETTHTFCIGAQPIEWWVLPRDHEPALARMLQLIEGASTSLDIAMYTWTHPWLTSAILRAHQRGVAVSILLDQGQAEGTGRAVLEALQKAGLSVRVGPHNKLLHHKFMWIDKTTLVSGSTNWTQSAFLRNQDCFFVLHTLTSSQQKKMEQTWFRTWTLARPPPTHTSPLTSLFRYRIKSISR